MPLALPLAMIALAALYLGATRGPRSLRAQFRARAQGVQGRAHDANPHAPLPAPVARYLQVTGFADAPRGSRFTVTFRGRIRSAEDARWMPFRAEQVSSVEPPTRLFFMHARALGVPIDALHELTEERASMRVSVLSAIPVVDQRGAELHRAEAVTQLNDLCILAPFALRDRRIVWEESDEHTARACFTLGSDTVRATLLFDEAGFLRDFVSDDRARLSADGKHFERLRFSTPVTAYRSFGPYRLASHGEARWELEGGSFCYGEFEILDVRYF